MRRIEIDTGEWPLVTIKFPAEPVTDADIRAYLGAVGALARSGRRYATVTDVRAMTAPLTAAQRWMFDAWLRRDERQLERVTIANAIVAASPVTRGAVETAYWRWRDRPRFRMFEQLAPARAWCRQRLRRAGLRRGRPPRLRAAPVPQPPAPSADTLDLFDEPAFLITRSGEVVFANQAATEAYDAPPSWLVNAVASGASAPHAPMRIARVADPARELFLVIPGAGASLGDLPPSLERVARLVCRGQSDKEIASSTGLTLPTVRTYMRRLYRRAGVHSRAELIRRWYARPGSAA